MTIQEALEEMKKFVQLKTTMSPAFVKVIEDALKWHNAELEAITDIQDKAKEVKYTDVTITALYNKDYNNLSEFLEGKLIVKLSGKMYDELIKIAESQEVKIEQAQARRDRLLEARNKVNAAE